MRKFKIDELKRKEYSPIKIVFVKYSNADILRTSGDITDPNEDDWFDDDFDL